MIGFRGYGSIVARFKYHECLFRAEVWHFLEFPDVVEDLMLSFSKYIYTRVDNLQVPPARILDEFSLNEKFNLLIAWNRIGLLQLVHEL
jgi:hypothetical protein